MIYFAYGSNLDYLQMAARCPRARLVGPGKLEGYRLCFPRRSYVRNSAVASIEAAAEGTVWGALYEIGEADIDRFDAREGYNPRCRQEENISTRVPVTVRLSDGSTVEAMTYVANPAPNPGLPSADYLSVIINGAMACRASDDYIAMLQALPTAA
ncbi:MAG TPA: gamma-glutamylcyclotransferase family protein [Bauldia sp.]|nr:gamma-glutamylcyclotransferase family protein [Bauldia sp.]